MKFGRYDFGQEQPENQQNENNRIVFGEARNEKLIPA
jgi:hypothetical protein